jgi:hypothetical protein
MLCEVMVLAEDHLRLYRGSKIDSKTGQPKVYTPYETLEDMGAYAKLADSVFHDIEISLKDEMRPAQVRSFAFPCVFGYLLCSHVSCVCVCVCVCYLQLPGAAPESEAAGTVSVYW